MTVRITHIRLSGGTEHEPISYLRWVNPVTGKTDSSTRAQMVAWIETQDGSAFVQQPSTPGRR